MKELINGQKIRIDNHRRGAGGIDYYDDPANDIHLDKTLYDGKKKNGEYQIRVPLNSERPVTVNRRENVEIPWRLLEEVQDAFADERKRSTFVNEMKEVLKGYPIKDGGRADSDKVKDAMEKISDAFDLGWNEGQVLFFVHDTVTQGPTFISLLHRGDSTYYLSMNYKRIVLADWGRIPKRFVGEWREV